MIQRHRRTDGRHAIARQRFALQYSVHRAVKRHLSSVLTADGRRSASWLVNVGRVNSRREKAALVPSGHVVVMVIWELCVTSFLAYNVTSLNDVA